MVSRLNILKEASEALKDEEMQRRTRKNNLEIRLKQSVIDNDGRLKLANTFITEARMGDELEGSTWEEYLPIDELYNHIPQFVEIMMDLRTLIIAERSNYEYIPNPEKRRPNASRRTQVRLMVKSFLSHLIAGEVDQALSSMGPFFSLWKDYQKYHTGKEYQRKSIKLTSKQVHSAETHLQEIQRSVVIHLVFEPLGSLLPPNENTKEDREMYTKLNSFGMIETIPQDELDRRRKLEEEVEFLEEPDPKKPYLNNPDQVTARDIKSRLGPKTSCGHTMAPHESSSNVLSRLGPRMESENFVNPGDSGGHIMAPPGSPKPVKSRLGPIPNLNKSANSSDSSPMSRCFHCGGMFHHQHLEAHMKIKHKNKDIRVVVSEQKDESEVLPDTRIVVLEQKEISEVPPSDPPVQTTPKVDNGTPKPSTSTDCSSSDSSGSSSSESSSSDSSSSSEDSKVESPKKAADSKNQDSNTGEVSNLMEVDDQEVAAPPSEKMEISPSKEKILSKETTARECFTLAQHGRRLKDPKGEKDTIRIRIDKELYSPDHRKVPDLSAFSAQFKNRSYDLSCKYNCVLRFINRVSLNWCTFGKPKKEDFSFYEIEENMKVELNTGRYQCFFTRRVPSHLQVILSKEKEGSKSKFRDDRHFYDEKEFVKRLEKLGFFEWVDRIGLISVDIEGPSELWLRDHNINKKDTDAVALIHFTSPNGIHCMVQVLWDGKSFTGASLPTKLERILFNNNICKIGFGVTEDIRVLNGIFKTNSVRNCLEAGRIVQFLKPDSLKSGKAAAAEMMSFTRIYTDPRNMFPNYAVNKEGKPISSNYHDNSQPVVNFLEQQNRYHRFDATLPFAILEKAILFYGNYLKLNQLSEDDRKNCGVGLIRAGIIALLSDNKLYCGNGDKAEAGQKGSQPMRPPYKSIAEFAEKNPFKKYNADAHMFDHDNYEPLETIALKISQIYQRIKFGPANYVFSNSSFKLWELPVVKAREDWTNLTFPHLCTSCGSTDHTSANCSSASAGLTNCEYPFCKSLEHDTKICPMVITECVECRVPGHRAHHHGKHEFCIIVAINTWLAYAKQHRIAAIMFESDVTFVTRTDDFDLQVSYPKDPKGGSSNGEHPFLKTEIRRC